MDFDKCRVWAHYDSDGDRELVFDFVGISEEDLVRMDTDGFRSGRHGIDDINRWCNFFGYWFTARIICRSRDNYHTSGNLVRTVLSHFFDCSIMNYSREDLKEYGPLFECFRTNVNNVFCYSPDEYTADVPYTLFKVGEKCYYAELIRGVYDGGKTWKPKLSYPDFKVDVKCGDDSCRQCPFFNAEYWEKYGKDNDSVKCNVPDFRLALFEDLEDPDEEETEEGEVNEKEE